MKNTVMFEILLLTYLPKYIQKGEREWYKIRLQNDIYIPEMGAQLYDSWRRHWDVS